jgi:hypothetical protein
VKSLFLFPQRKRKSNPAYGGLNYSHKKLQICPILKKLDTCKMFRARGIDIFTTSVFLKQETGRAGNLK